MITGFNTDIRHREVVFHVQTEDKGEEAASVESLVYVGGRVLARRQVTYRALLDRGEGKAAVARLMDRQHRLMISQVRGGRFDQEVFAGGPPPVADLAARPDDATVRVTVQRSERPLAGLEADLAAAAEAPPPAATPEVAPPPAAPAPAAEEPAPTLEWEPVPEAAPAPGPDGSLTLDQVIFDYLSSIAAQEQLVLLMDETPALASGATSQLEFHTHTSRSGRPIAGARVTVRMISTLLPPRTLASGKTDGEGLLRLAVAVPAAVKDTAALIISAASELGDAEIKQLL